MKPVRCNTKYLLGLLVLLIGGGVLPLAAQVQSFQMRSPTPYGPIFLVPEVTYNVAELGDLTSTDLSAMPAAWWKETVKRHIRLLTSEEDTVRERTLQNLIFFIKQYPEATDYHRAVNRLLKVYHSDTVEQHRIMALGAVAAIGSDWGMNHLRESVQEEESERVRRYTLLALASYYKNR